MNNLPVKIKEVVDGSHLPDLTKAEKIASNYAPLMIRVNEQMQILKTLKKGNPEDVETAKRVRLDLGHVNSETDAQKKADKAVVLLEGGYIDALYNTVSKASKITQGEAREIEDYFENQEKERKAKLQIDRVLLLDKYVEDAEQRNLGDMDDDVWKAFFSIKKTEHKDKIAAEKLAKQKRIAREKEEEKERKRVAAENLQLKKEKEEREKEEQIRIEKDKKEKELARKEEEKKQLERDQEAEKQRKIQEEKDREHHEQLENERRSREKSEREAREKQQLLEDELKRKEEEEDKRKQLEEQRKEAELNKGDSDKVSDLISDLESIATKYEFKSVKNKKMMASVIALIRKVIHFIQN